MGSREDIAVLAGAGMAGLFEEFVACWLEANLPAGYRLHRQLHLNIGQFNEAVLRIDLVIERSDGMPLWVLDTKCKVPSAGPATDDLYQVVYYAEAHGVSNAGLIYPSTVPQPLDVVWGKGGVRVSILIFPLDGDPDAAGAALLDSLELPT